MGNDKLKTLKAAFKAMMDARVDCLQSIDKSGLEQYRLAVQLREKMKAYSDLFASLDGSSTIEIPKPPTHIAIVKDK